MKNLRTMAWCSCAAVALGLALPSTAHAADSAKGPFYVQAGVLGYSFRGGGAAWFGGAYNLDVEFGYHFSGRHDGFVLAARQAFYFSGGALGTTDLRIGYDVALPMKDGKYELTIAPYGLAGVGYALRGGLGTDFHVGAGIEGRFFPMQSNGFYVFARPLELTYFAGTLSFWNINPNAGIGIAF
jgi:hypothetical protein